MNPNKYIIFTNITVSNPQLYLNKGLMYSIQYTPILTLWSRVLLEKLAGSQLVKKLPALYGT